MTAVVFVHGTGVRETGFSELIRRFGEGLSGSISGHTVVPYYWGTEHGARLAADGASLPAETDGASRSTPEPDLDEETRLWELLYRDPLGELAAAAAAGRAPAGPAAELPPGAVHPAELPRRLLARLGASPSVEDTALPGIRRAASEVARSPLLGRAAPVLADAGSGVLERVLARAVAATCLRDLLEADVPVIPDGEMRDRAVEQLATAMGAPAAGSDRGLGSFLLQPVARVASGYAVSRRRALTEAAHPAAGDVLRYLAHGEPVRAGLRKVLAGLEGPVAIVGHSLGGIIALDTLVRDPHPQVRLLVTVGSQAPFLYEIGALPSLGHPSALPGHFPAWLNLYDRRDLLSHVGGSLFPGRVHDILIDNRQPFPASHSAYWTNPAVYTAIAGGLR
ncbi:hypothetical protein [Streptomyces sp. NPDC051211]|uniref:hypothetical protein n=1 Tax=Streptomyces sp. NPDC051211 TaxID=3154643 RepID=UPI00344B8EA0